MTTTAKAKPPVHVEILEQGRWTSIGRFSAQRARQLVPLLRKEGKIIRTDNETYRRQRIGWTAASKDPEPTMLLGSVDDIDIFVLAHQPYESRWTLYVRLPGHDGKPVYAESEDEAKGSAELVLDTFIRRMGVMV